MKGSKRWRRDEIAELVTAFKIRNVLIAEVVAQRVSNQIRSMLGINSADAATFVPSTGTDTATHKRVAVNADVGDGSDAAIPASTKE